MKTKKMKDDNMNFVIVVQYDIDGVEHNLISEKDAEDLPDYLDDDDSEELFKKLDSCTDLVSDCNDLHEIIMFIKKHDFNVVRTVEVYRG